MTEIKCGKWSFMRRSKRKIGKRERVGRWGVRMGLGLEGKWLE